MPALDLSAKRFGRLVVTKRAVDGMLPGGRRYVRWHARCNCGSDTIVSAAHLRAGITKSCGCRRRDNRIAPHIKHGEGGRSKSAEYRAWIAMKNRCLNPNQDRFADYGGRGISVCVRWLKSFENFLSDMGRKPSPLHTLDRKDNNGDYKPSNCRWATPEQQRANQRRRLRLDQFTDQELVEEIVRRGYPNPLRIPQHH